MALRGGSSGLLVPLGLPGRVWVWLAGFAVLGSALGTALIGIGLLSTRRRLLAGGLLAMVPALIADLLLTPGRGSLLVHPDGSEGLHAAVVLRSAAELAGTAAALVYAWWVWRAYLRMVTDRD